MLCSRSSRRDNRARTRCSITCAAFCSASFLGLLYLISKLIPELKTHSHDIGHLTGTSSVRLLIVCHLLLHGPAFKVGLSHINDNETSQIGDELSDDDREEKPVNVLVSSVK
jgi:hypothetical protein